MKLRLTHLEQLLHYINTYEESGCYYGSKKQFIKRHNELALWVENLIKKSERKMRNPWDVKDNELFLTKAEATHLYDKSRRLEDENTKLKNQLCKLDFELCLLKKASEK